MGLGESKPSNVSDEAWERVQVKKLEAEKQKFDAKTAKMDEANLKLDELEKTIREGTANSIRDFSEYCSACHDVPRFMMVFPNNRERCTLAREKLLNNTSGTAISMFRAEATKEMISEINKM